MERGATISPDGVFRYELWRIWRPDLLMLCWIMLNPSTADADIDDQTIMTIMAISRARGYGGIMVVNLFAYRATKPRELELAGYPEGPGNDLFILTAVSRCKNTVFAWGANAPEARVRKLLKGWSWGTPLRLDSLKTANGMPRHPLYHKHDTRLIECRFPEDWCEVVSVAP
jgi:hypothetical protein